MRVRFLTLALGLLLAGTARANLVYVLNSGEASVTVLDAATRQELRRIPMLREPHHLVLTPDGSQLVIADSGGNEVIFVDPAKGEVQRRERISNPYHLEYSPDGRYLMVASLRRDQVDLYSAHTLSLIQRFRPGDMPSHIAFSPDSKRAFVTLQGDRAVAAFDLDNRTHLWTQEVGPEPAGVTWHRGKLLVGIMGSDHFVSLDPETREVSRAFAIGRGAHTIFPAPDGRALYATSRVDSRVAEIDPDTLAVRRVWNIAGGPDCLTFDQDGRIWMTLRWVGRVAVLDPRETEWTTIRVGRSPHGIFHTGMFQAGPPEAQRSGPGQGVAATISGSRPAPVPAATPGSPAVPPNPVQPAAARQ